MGAGLQGQVARLLADLRHAQRQAEEEAAALQAASAQVATTREAQALVNEVAQAVQESAHRQIASIVTRCLKAVFGEESYELQINFSKGRGRTEATFVLRRDGFDVDPVEAAGGGVLDLAAFALRLAALVLVRPAKRRLLVLDEPFKHLSSVYRPRVRELLEVLAEDLGVQMLLVTHSEELVTGKVVRLS